jgi:hypothetical protein
MISKTFQTLLWAVILASFTGAASTQEIESDASAPEDSDAAPSYAETCVNIQRAQDIVVLSDRHVYVRTLGGNHYLLTMTQTCRNLQRSYRSGGVRIQPYGRLVCPNDGSHLVYTWFDRESVCPIMTIDAVEDRMEARDLADHGRIPVEVEEIILPE